MFRKNLRNIWFCRRKEIFQLIYTNDWYTNNFSSLFLEIFSNRHFIEGLIELFELINNKIISEYKSLVIGPYLVHLLYEIIRIISLYHIFSSGWNILSNELSNIASDFLVNMGFLFNGWFWSWECKIVDLSVINKKDTISRVYGWDWCRTCFRQEFEIIKFYIGQV